MINFLHSSQTLDVINQIVLFFAYLWEVIKVWWWLPLPFILFYPFRYLYLWYIQEKWFDKIDWAVYEIRIPRDNDRPLKAMEQVISDIWPYYDPPAFREKWITGKFLISFSLEIASIDGIIHFFIRIPRDQKDLFETAVYSQYPQVEIFEVEDYTKKVPQDIPNAKWDLWGCDYEMLKKSCYPIKVYSKFFEPKEDLKIEQRIDPLAVLLEGISKMKPGEQFWFQMILKPIIDEVPWIKEAKEEIDSLVGRKKATRTQRTIIGEAIHTFITNEPPYSSSKNGTESEGTEMPPEMQLTPGERKIVEAIEEKISKQAFEANIRFIYLGRREVFFKPRVKLGINFSSGLSTNNLNGFKPWSVTLTKVTAPALFRRRRIFLKQRRMFRNYVKRRTPLFPKPGGTFVLNTEEIATIYHFPSRISAPALGLPFVEAKKGGMPPNVPIEKNGNNGDNGNNAAN